MRIVTGDKDVARFAAQPIANPFGRVLGLKIARRRKRREGVAGAPVRLGRLTGAKLTAVPHDRGVRPPRRGFSRKPTDLLPSLFGKRAPRIDFGPYRVAVMDKIKSQVA
jgi:hypothetical protein